MGTTPSDKRGWFSQGVSFFREFWFTLTLFFVFSIIGVFACLVVGGVRIWSTSVLNGTWLFVEFLTIYFPWTCIAYFCVVVVAAVVYCLK